MCPGSHGNNRSVDEVRKRQIRLSATFLVCFLPFADCFFPRLNDGALPAAHNTRFLHANNFALGRSNLALCSCTHSAPLVLQLASLFLETNGRVPVSQSSSVPSRMNLIVDDSGQRE